MTIKQALSILRPVGPTEKDLKEAYRAAAFKFHPDKGGDAEIMKLVNNAYDLLCKASWTVKDREEAENTVPLTEVLAALWSQFKHFPDLSGEICGSWLWITGNTRQYRTDLKAAGFKFAAKKAAWYFHEEPYRKRNSKHFTMNEIRDLWGSSDLDKDEHRTVYA